MWIDEPYRVTCLSFSRTLKRSWIEYYQIESGKDGRETMYLILFAVVIVGILVILMIISLFATCPGNGQHQFLGSRKSNRVTLSPLCRSIKLMISRCGYNDVSDIPWVCSEGIKRRSVWLNGSKSPHLLEYSIAQWSAKDFSSWFWLIYKK